MRCDELKDLVPLHLTGLLGDEETAALEEHLAGGCPNCAAEVAANAATLGELPYGLPLEEPSPMAKVRLMARVRKETGTVSPISFLWPKTAAAAIAAAALSALLTGVMVTRRGVSAIGELRDQVVRQREEMASLRDQIQKARETVRLISAPGVLVVNLQGQGTLAGSAARVFWDRSATSWQLYADKLPTPPAGRVYQLWLITGKSKISAGLLDPGGGTASGTVTVPADEGPVLAAAVTDEPAGGSSQPTGSILLLGKD